MIWVHGPRYLRAMHPDHEKLLAAARDVTGLRLFARDSGRAVLERPHYYGADAGRGALAAACGRPHPKASQCGLAIATTRYIEV
jgi:hypothetical protein